MKASLSAQLLLSHLCVGLIPLLLISLLLWNTASKGLDKVSNQGAEAVERAAYNELQLMCQIKEKQIDHFFRDIVGQMHMLRDNPWFVRMYHNLDQAFTEVGKSAESEDGSIHSEIWRHLALQADVVFQDVCTDFDWNNLYLINNEGSIIYSLHKFSDLGQSLARVPLISTSLGKAFAKLRDNPEQTAAFGDYAPYGPLDNEPSAFLITQVKQEKDDRGAAYLAVQPSTSALRNMIKMETARKQTLEAYVVGVDGYMRSDSVLDPENYSRTASFQMGNKVLTKASREAIAGQNGTGIVTDYRGVSVLSSWTPIEIMDIRWALICEIDEHEALAAKMVMEQSGEDAGRGLMQWIAMTLLLTLAIVGVIAWLVARSISRPIVHAAEVAGIIASGDMQQRLNMKREDEIGQMAAALDAMVDKVARNFRQVNGAAELAERMRGEQDVRILAKNVVSFLAGFLSAQMGSLYLADKKGSSLSLVGSYAFNKRKGIDTAIQLGEGIAGQAAAERILISVTDLPSDYVRISSTLGSAVPRNVLALPFLHQEKLVGVLEFASFKEFSDEDIAFLNQIAESIAIVFNAAHSRQEVQELLAETQAQSEELRASNEELEAQTAALKEFQEELKSQQAELEIVNANLKEKSENLVTQKNEIEQRNKELTAAREEVEERSKDLAMASKYKSEFLANMSHELRTPLNSLLLLAKSLADNREGTLSTHQQESAKVIVESGKDLLNLINEILDLSKIEAGRIELDLEEVPLADLTANANTMFRHMAESKGLEFIVSLDSSLPSSIVTDRKRVEQILKNFLGNSIKFTAKGRVGLAIARPAPQTKFRRNDLLPGKTIAFSVSDTGIGIPLDKQKVIFEAFQQADGSTSRKYGGTGLGLSISRELAVLLGGEIQLVSESGKGATFTLYLPCEAGQPSTLDKQKPAEPPLLAEEKQSAPPSAPVPRSQSLADDRAALTVQDRSILIIEDDLKFAKILMDQCRERGFKALTADTGEEGLLLAEQHQPTGIILDIKLPGINGWTVLTSLKTNPATRHIPVHMMSVEEVSREAFKKGAVGFFTKPVDREQIAETFSRFEEISSRKVKKLLVVEDDDKLRRAVIDLVGSGDTVTMEAKTGQEAHDLLRSQQFDCMILDLGLPDCNGIELLRKLAADSSLTVPPVIIHTGRELSRDEEKELNKYSESIIIKNARSEERLLDETTLFLHRMVEELPEQKQEIIAGLQDQEAVFRNRKILLVDDDMRNVFALSNVLEERGMEVLIAEHGRKALDILDKEEQIDLVLMDIMMPEMDGYEATRKIREQKRFRTLPVIALTAKAMKEDREKCIEAGASDYLTKPIDLDRLLSMMRVWLYR